MPSLCEADFIDKGAYHLNEHKKSTVEKLDYEWGTNDLKNAK